MPFSSFRLSSLLQKLTKNFIIKKKVCFGSDEKVFPFFGARPIMSSNGEKKLFAECSAIEFVRSTREEGRIRFQLALFWMKVANDVEIYGFFQKKKAFCWFSARIFQFQKTARQRRKANGISFVFLLRSHEKHFSREKKRRSRGEREMPFRKAEREKFYDFSSERRIQERLNKAHNRGIWDSLGAGAHCTEKRWEFNKLWAHLTYLVQFSRYKTFNETVTSQIFSTHRSRTSTTSCIALGDNVTLYGWVTAPLPLLLLLTVCVGFNWRFVDAKVLCCICEAPPSMARKMNEPEGEGEEMGRRIN